ncbi:MAG TPA: hypothetical protein VHX61_08440 [Rhizomicrobium sp.]|jgi:Mg/Co/Ni transporter MgtE|nr:hypothetical protein [Rhizomicrobium sp.]
MADLDSYAEELLRAKGATLLTNSELEQAKSDLIDEIDEEVNAMILDHLPDDARDAYEHLLDKDDEEATRRMFVMRQAPGSPLSRG